MKKIAFILFFVLFPIFATAMGIVEINTASLQQLDDITGIGPVLAQRIVDARPFSSVDGLLKVKGIGQKTLQKIKAQGLAYVAGQAQNVSDTNNQTLSSSSSSSQSSSSSISSTPSAAITYPGGVFINEILPNPQGPDETDEWIELYNSNNFDIDLSGWQIKDIIGTPTTYTIPQNTKILANGFLVFKRPDTKIMLNNDQDGLNLLTPDSKIVDSVVFASAPLNQSYNKTDSGWQWSLVSTPGTKNIVTADQTISLTKNSIKTLQAEKNSAKNNIELGLADVSQTITADQNDNEETNPWFLFLVVFATTIVLASIVLFVKLKFKSSK